MFLSDELKQANDDDVRRRLRPELAEICIAANRTIKRYLIEYPDVIKVSDHCYSKAVRWHIAKEVECDWDDAITHKNLLAKSLGKDATMFRLTPA